MNYHYPMKGINNMSGYNFSYIHSVLESLSCLDSTTQFVILNNSNNMLNCPQYALTKALYDVINTLKCGGEANSANIIEQYKKAYLTNFQNNSALTNFQNNLALTNSPYYFLFFLLEFLHLENNIPLNPNYNIQNLYSQNLQNQKNDNYMYFLFLGFFKQTQNSFILDFFYNIEKSTYRCLNCGMTYFYRMKKIFKFNVDMVRYYRNMAYPNRRGFPITLDDCFKCYTGGNSNQCKNCRNQNSFVYNKICCSAKVLMIYFERNNHYYRGDVDIINQFNIGNYYSISRTGGLNYNPSYNLKACISLCNIGTEKYFADCFIKNNNLSNTGSWYRFMDNQIKSLNNPIIEIKEFEPQILIYELDEFYFNNNLIFNPFNTMNRNSNNMKIFREHTDNLINNSQFMLFRAMFNFIRGAQNICDAQRQNQNIMMNMYNNNNDFQNNNQNMNIQTNPIQNNNSNFQLIFSIVPEQGDQSFNKNLRIFAHVTSNYTVEMAINNFYSKLLKKREAITKFLLNGNQLNPSSQQTLGSLNINENTIIKAIKANNFDQLDLPGDQVPH